MKIVILYGTLTGNTKKIAFIIYNKIKNFYFTKIYNIKKCNLNMLHIFNILILGTSTWFYGKIQNDWKNFLLNYKCINLNNKFIALFGCGNQKLYINTFCDGIYKLYKVFVNDKNILLGFWYNINYNFIYSKALLNKNYFLGLLLDLDNQNKFTNTRINIWVSNLLVNFSQI